MSNIWDELNSLFGNMDAAFRSMERENGWFNRFPVITLPSVKSTYVDRRTYHDGEKTIKLENGMVHCGDGPAIIYDDENTEDEYWLKGVKTTKEEVESNIKKIEDSRIHNVHVDGKTYNITGKQLRELDLSNKLKNLEHKNKEE